MDGVFAWYEPHDHMTQAILKVYIFMLYICASGICFDLNRMQQLVHHHMTELERGSALEIINS